MVRDRVGRERVHYEAPPSVEVPREMAAFLDSNHACEPTVVEKLLKDKGFLLLLARHYESVGNIEGALNILAGLVDGKQGDALEQSIDTSATVSKIADLLSGQQDASLVSEYGRWLVRKDPEAGIRILTAQTAASDSAATSKTPSRSKAQELDAIRLQKATIDELRGKVIGRWAGHGPRPTPTERPTIDDETADLIDELVRNRAPSDAQVASAPDD